MEKHGAEIFRRIKVLHRKLENGNRDAIRYASDLLAREIKPAPREGSPIRRQLLEYYESVSGDDDTLDSTERSEDVNLLLETIGRLVTTARGRGSKETHISTEETTEILGGVIERWPETATEHETPTSTEDAEPAKQKKEKAKLLVEVALNKFEQETPELDIESADWIASRKKNKDKLKLDTGTLADYRSLRSGGQVLDAYFGIDRDGRRWRRDRSKTPGSQVYYLLEDIEKCRSKVPNR